MNCTDIARRRNTPDEMVKVIQAHERGDTVQSRLTGPRSPSTWSDTPNPRFNFAMRQYRVKPQPPAEGWAAVSKSGRIAFAHSDKSRVEDFANRFGSRRVCRVIEVQD